MDVFISYRRSNGTEIAMNFCKTLENMGYDCFLDSFSITEGKFPECIIQNINISNNFIILLTPHCLDRCEVESDWVRKELTIAITSNKNIIPVICSDFEFPENIPDDIATIQYIQAEQYSSEYFEKVVEKIINRLKDKAGNSLRLSKMKNISNTFYEDVSMSTEELQRIRNDYESVKSIESDIFKRLLTDKKDISLFNPAIYEINTYMDKYNFDEISHVYGLMNRQEDVNAANNTYGHRFHQINAFYIGNMEHDNFTEEMDRILIENRISGFDFADLTLILRDLVNPIEKLRQVVERMNPGGIVYIRELDHAMALAYPDKNGFFKKMFEYIRKDEYSGDYEAGRKVYYWMKNADLEDIHFEAKQVSTVGMKKREKRILFSALFSYVQNEYEVMYDKEKSQYRKSAIEWLKEHYQEMENEFCNDDFFYSSGFMEFYGFVEQ